MRRFLEDKFLGEFETGMQIYISGLDNFQEFSQPKVWPYEVM